MVEAKSSVTAANGTGNLHQQRSTRGIFFIAGLAPIQAVGLVVMLIALFALHASEHLLGRRVMDSDDCGGAFQALSHPGVLFIAVLCFLVFLIEGAMLDWSAVFLHMERGLDKSQSGFGYTLYASAVALSRFYGDRLVNAYGRQRLLMLGSACASAGLLLIVAIDLPVVTLAGFILTGMGLSNMVPILFSAAGTVELCAVSRDPDRLHGLTERSGTDRLCG